MNATFPIKKVRTEPGRLQVTAIVGCDDLASHAPHLPGGERDGGMAEIVKAKFGVGGAEPRHSLALWNDDNAARDHVVRPAGVVAPDQLTADARLLPRGQVTAPCHHREHDPDDPEHTSHPA
jgi:hypothetical protein